jgi:hypothetical protein
LPSDPPVKLSAIVSARISVGQTVIKAAMTRTGASLREDRDGTVTSGVSFFIFIMELDIKSAVFEPELECHSWQLASVIGKHGNEFICQDHQLLATRFVKSSRNPTKRGL